VHILARKNVFLWWVAPTTRKHDIDYEFSEFNRNDLIYQFAKSITKEQKESLQPPKPKVEA
jgi:hypothetical protein